MEDPHRVAPRQPQRLGLHTAGEAPGRGVRAGGVSRQRHGRSRARIRACALLEPQRSARDQAVHRSGVDAIGHAGRTRPRPDGGQQVAAGRPTELEQVGVRPLWRQEPPELLPRRYDDRFRQSVAARRPRPERGRPRRRTSPSATRCSPSAYSPQISRRPRRGRTSRPALVRGSATRAVASPQEATKRRPTFTTRSSGTLTLTWVENPVSRSAPIFSATLLASTPARPRAGRRGGAGARPVPGDRGRGQLGLPAVGGERHPRGEPAGPGIAGVEGAQSLGDDRAASGGSPAGSGLPTRRTRARLRLGPHEVRTHYWGGRDRGGRAVSPMEVIVRPRWHSGGRCRWVKKGMSRPRSSSRSARVPSSRGPGRR